MGNPMLTHLLIINIIILLAFSVMIFAYKCKISKKNETKLKEEIEEVEEIRNDNEDIINDLILVLVGLNKFALNSTGVRTKEQLNKLIVQYACRLMKVESASIMLLNSKGELSITASQGIPQLIVEKARVKLGEQVSGYVAQTGIALLVKDIEDDTRLKINRKSNTRYPSKSFICVPLRKRNELIGVLNVNSNDISKSFSNRDMRLLTILVEQAGFTLENIELYFNLQNFYLEFVQTLLRAIDAKDHDTCEHATRTKDYVAMTAKKLNLPDNILQNIEYAALMHDIGKIGVDESILKKAGTLTKEERKVIEQHPSIGSQIISPVGFLSEVASIVLYHQEWYDGHGYPDGIKGEDIPIGARIISVMDAYDAMTSGRPYRAAIDVSSAVAELKKFAGTQFDPKVVGAFVEVLTEQKVYQPQL